MHRAVCWMCGAAALASEIMLQESCGCQQVHALNQCSNALTKFSAYICSASGASVVAIDNKIEQAMDLVKSHLMYAVREEVEVLKEQIKELVERNSLLERENALLKSLSNNDQLSQLSAQQANPSSTLQAQAVMAQPAQPAQPPQQPNVSSA